MARQPNRLRRALLTQGLYYLFVTLFVAAGLANAWAALVHEDHLNHLATAVLMAVLIAWFFSVKRVRDNFRDLGRWDERMEVLRSMTEASERGMSQQDWMDSYAERIMVEAAIGLAEVQGEGGRDERPEA